MTGARNQPATPGKSRVPVVKTLREEAEFWDTHDLTDFWDETRPVKINFSGASVNTLDIALESDVMKALEERAKLRGTPPRDLAKQWIEERLRSTS